MEAGKDSASALRCQRCTSSNWKLRDRAREFNESTLTLKAPSMPCLKQRCGRWRLVVRQTNELWAGPKIMMIAFIIFNSSLVPLIVGLWSSNPWEFEFSGFRRNQTDDLGINCPLLWPTEPRLHVRSWFVNTNLPTSSKGQTTHQDSLKKILPAVHFVS